MLNQKDIDDLKALLEDAKIYNAFCKQITSMNRSAHTCDNNMKLCDTLRHKLQNYKPLEWIPEDEPPTEFTDTTPYVWALTKEGVMLGTLEWFKLDEKWIFFEVDSDMMYNYTHYILLHLIQDALPSQPQKTANDD